MKHILTLSFIAVLLASCGGDKKNSVEKILEKNNLEDIRTKRAELVSEQEDINSKIKLLDERIKTLDTTQNIPLITTILAKEEVFDHVLELQGNVTTKNLLIITPEYSGILTNVYVTEGQRVSKGQTLAKIDDGGLSQQLAQLKIQSSLAKTTFERQQKLWNQKIGSEIQYLQAKSSYEAQEEAINQLQKQLSKTIVRAPFSGTIDDVITEKGSVVGAGQTPLMQIVNLDDMYIETDVPESYIPTVVQGKNVTVQFPVLGTSIDTKVRQAGDVINVANRTFKIEVAVPNKDKTIKPNLTAKLKINDYTNPKAILVPQSIISENAEGEQYVYIVKDKKDNNQGTVSKVIIKTGKTQGDVIEVLEGITNGAELIQEGARSVKDGQTVKVIKY
ncbi:MULTISPECIES: efflux RND transporter periplasmic adaptor subunit [unclassified Olleya]|jgi:RND family efflux transporter MFP subunit|uniref:efflux RND transporter periplasmic adaptor subunit n=1 Tax=unclassified Olleya TaxID=2615019 RepID=UPI0011A4FC90|nr:efflux RND transporter periplasmic adaptor subunit [Olleya sp. Hel_I_94]TVZ48443.1 RND family efflux transporter MFP subunit [Olleya sp. Hel_I_94]